VADEMCWTTLDGVADARRQLDAAAHELNQAMLAAYDDGQYPEVVATHGGSTAAHVRMLVLSRADAGQDPADAPTPADEAPW